jgi:hypothetical protein
MGPLARPPARSLDRAGHRDVAAKHPCLLSNHAYVIRSFEQTYRKENRT